MCFSHICIKDLGMPSKSMLLSLWISLLSLLSGSLPPLCSFFVAVLLGSSFPLGVSFLPHSLPLSPLSRKSLTAWLVDPENAQEDGFLGFTPIPWKHPRSSSSPWSLPRGFLSPSPSHDQGSLGGSMERVVGEEGATEQSWLWGSQSRSECLSGPGHLPSPFPTSSLSSVAGEAGTDPFSDAARGEGSLEGVFYSWGEVVTFVFPSGFLSSLKQPNTEAVAGPSLAFVGARLLPTRSLSSGDSGVAHGLLGAVRHPGDLSLVALVLPLSVWLIGSCLSSSDEPARPRRTARGSSHSLPTSATTRD